MCCFQAVCDNIWYCIYVLIEHDFVYMNSASMKSYHSENVYILKNIYFTTVFATYDTAVFI